MHASGRCGVVTSLDVRAAVLPVSLSAWLGSIPRPSRPCPWGGTTTTTLGLLVTTVPGKWRPTAAVPSWNDRPPAKPADSPLQLGGGREHTILPALQLRKSSACCRSSGAAVPAAMSLDRRTRRRAGARERAVASRASCGYAPRLWRGLRSGRVGGAGVWPGRGSGGGRRAPRRVVFSARRSAGGGADPADHEDARAAHGEWRRELPPAEPARGGARLIVAAHSLHLLPQTAVRAAVAQLAGAARAGRRAVRREPRHARGCAATLTAVDALSATSRRAARRRRPRRMAGRPARRCPRWHRARSAAREPPQFHTVQRLLESAAAATSTGASGAAGARGARADVVRHRAAPARGAAAGGEGGGEARRRRRRAARGRRARPPAVVAHRAHPAPAQGRHDGPGDGRQRRGRGDVRQAWPAPLLRGGAQGADGRRVALAMPDQLVPLQAAKQRPEVTYYYYSLLLL